MPEVSLTRNEAENIWATQANAWLQRMGAIESRIIQEPTLVPQYWFDALQAITGHPEGEIEEARYHIMSGFAAVIAFLDIAFQEAS